MFGALFFYDTLVRQTLINPTGSHSATRRVLRAGLITLVVCLLNEGALRAESAPPVLKSSSTGMEFVAVRPGSFLMGSPLGEPERDENETPHEVTLSKPFYLGVYEVTQDEFTKVMGFNPSTLKGADR